MSDTTLAGLWQATGRTPAAPGGTARVPWSSRPYLRPDEYIFLTHFRNTVDNIVNPSNIAHQVQVLGSVVLAQQLLLSAIRETPGGIPT